MWVSFVLWLWRGGDGVSIQPTDIPPPIHVRTIHDVERELTAVNARIVKHRSRQGETVNRHECVNHLPAEDVAEAEALLDEWAWHHAGGPALDFPVNDRADEQPMVTLTGGPLDADCA